MYPNQYGNPQQPVGVAYPQQGFSNQGYHPAPVQAPGYAPPQQHYGAAQPAYPTQGYPPTGAPSYPSANGAPYGAGQPQCAPVNPGYPAPGGIAYPVQGVPPMAHPQQPPQGQQPYQEIPSIKVVQFDPVSDAQALRRAMKGLGTDESAIINVLSRRTDFQRQQIRQAFKTNLGRDLIKDLKSELSGHLEDTAIALVTPRIELLAKRLHSAMKGIGTDEKVLVEVLCTSTNQEIKQINAIYSQLFGKSLEAHMKSETSGYFKKFLIALNSAGRCEDPYPNPTLASTDAQQLYKAGEKRLGTDESAFISVLCTRSPAQIRLIVQEYQRISSNSLEKAIKKEFSGDIQKGLLALVKCANNRAAFFAEQLYESMAGMGTNDEDLIFYVVTRADVDMENIKQEYPKKYKKSLAQHISGDTSGHYKKMLLALIGA